MSTTEEKLACSLTADTIELIPFLPYLLQDLWELGSDPEEMTRLIRKNLTVSEDTKILDLACGKGAVSIKIAKSLNVRVYGLDLLPDFIAYAKNKAKEMGVDSLCSFGQRDVNEAVKEEKGYDCVILGATGNILGDPKETLKKLSGTVRPGGFILIDEVYLAEGHENMDMKWAYEHMTRGQWAHVFAELGLRLTAETMDERDYDFEAETRAIAARARELGEKYPEKRVMFEKYVQNQMDECNDLENSLVGVTLMLQVP